MPTMRSTAMPETARPDARRGQRPVTLTASGPYFAALFVIALVAFWPYLSQVTSSTGYTHLHALTAAMWMVMLVAQPLAIRTRRLGLHRTVGECRTLPRPSSSSAYCCSLIARRTA